MTRMIAARCRHPRSRARRTDEQFGALAPGDGLAAKFKRGAGMSKGRLADMRAHTKRLDELKAQRAAMGRSTNRRRAA